MKYTNVYNKQENYEVFKCNVCHHLKHVGDIQFLIDILDNNIIDTLYNEKRYGETLYMLAMFDYISRINDIPMCNKYNKIRKLKLPNIIYPTDVYCSYLLTKDNRILEDSFNKGIPEFKRFNIVENEVRDIA